MKTNLIKTTRKKEIPNCIVLESRETNQLSQLFAGFTLVQRVTVVSAPQRVAVFKLLPKPLVC